MNDPRSFPFAGRPAGRNPHKKFNYSQVLPPISRRPLIGLKTAKALTPDRLVVMAPMAMAPLGPASAPTLFCSGVSKSRTEADAGSVITEDVESDAMAFGRSRQVAKPGRARAFRAARLAAKESKKD